MDVRDYLERIQSDATAAIELLDADGGGGGGEGTIVRAGEHLQSYLDAGGVLTLEAGATFEGNFVIRTAGTHVHGDPGSAIHGIGGGPPALQVLPGTDDIEIQIPAMTTSGDQAVLLIGADDDTQTTLDAVPDGILIADTHVPTHRGKRAFEIHGTHLTMQDCSCHDVYDPAGRDSSGIAINNTPGAITIRGGVFEAGSMNFIIGGTPVHIPGVLATGVVLEDVELSRPDSWRTDGISRKVKANFELKAGRDVTLRRARLTGCWVDGQTGNAIMLTPRDAQTVDSVLLEDVTITKCVNALSLLSHDNGAYTPMPLHHLTLRRVRADVEGRFAQLGGEPHDITFEDCDFEGADNTMYSYESVVWDSPNVSRMGYIQRGIIVRNNRLASRNYGFMLTGPNGGCAYGLNWRDAWPDGTISGNYLHGETARAHEPNLPADNTYAD